MNRNFPNLFKLQPGHFSFHFPDSNTLLMCNTQVTYSISLAPLNAADRTESNNSKKISLNKQKSIVKQGRFFFFSFKNYLNSQWKKKKKFLTNNSIIIENVTCDRVLILEIYLLPLWIVSVFVNLSHPYFNCPIRC